MEEAKKRINEWIKNNDPEQVLDLYGLNLKILPDLPHNLKRLSCSSNQLTQLPDLPNCQTLECWNNQLTQLPALPHCQHLDCSGNQYLYITKEMAIKYNLRETPNYLSLVKPIQIRWKARFRLLKLRRLQRHIDAFRYRLYSLGFKELAQKYASIML